MSACSLPLGTLTTLIWRPDDRSVGILMSFGGGALLAALTIGPGRLRAREGRVLLVCPSAASSGAPCSWRWTMSSTATGDSCASPPPWCTTCVASAASASEGARGAGADCRVSRSPQGGHRGSRLVRRARGLSEGRHALTAPEIPLTSSTSWRRGGVDRGPSRPGTLTGRAREPGDSRSACLHYRLPSHAPCGGQPSSPTSGCSRATSFTGFSASRPRSTPSVVDIVASDTVAVYLRNRQACPRSRSTSGARAPWWA